MIKIMKKKILLLFIILLFLIIFTSKTYVQAEEINQTSTSGAQLNQLKIVKYDLAFPGMLPDKPLYKLKVLRDRISVALMSDHQRKIDFYLLQTDKGILATAMLVDYGKIDLAQTTALKAEHNYTILVNEIKQTSKKPDADIFQKLKIAAAKHQEVLNSIIKKLPAEKQKTFKTVLDFSKRNLKVLEKMEKKNSNSWEDWEQFKLE